MKGTQSARDQAHPGQTGLQLCAQDIAGWTTNPVDLNGDETVSSQDMGRLLEAIARYNSLD